MRERNLEDATTSCTKVVVCVCNSVMTKSFSSTQSQTHEQTWVCTRPMEGSPGK